MTRTPRPTRLEPEAEPALSARAGKTAPKTVAAKKPKAGASKPKKAAPKPAPMPAPPGEVLCEVRWTRAAPEAGRIALSRLASGRFGASVDLPGWEKVTREAADLETLIGWLEALELPRALIAAPAAAAGGACLAEDRLEDLLMQAARQALREKFDQLRGEALAGWSEIQAKESP